MSPARRKAAAKPKPAEPRARKPRAPRPSPTVKKLAAALELGDDLAQCSALAGLVGALARARAVTAAAGALAHTAAGGPIARAYLTVVATPGDEPVAAADLIAKRCATIDRGRKVLRPIFARTWSRAKDLRAVDDASENLEREAVDDPELLAAGAEAAMRLGDRAAAVERTTRLERAKRLAPRLAGLTAEAARDLPAEDRRHVYARVLAAPGAFEPELAVAAIAELADDAAIPDLALSSAIAELGETGGALVDTWKQRVSAGSTALITRLLALFEWAALRAKTADELVPFMHALHPAAGRSDVFAQLDGALASDRAIVREAALRGWLADRGGMAMFDDAQADKLIRSAIALAEDRDEPDARAARGVLAGAVHAGGAPAMMAAIARRGRSSPRSERTDRELRACLFRGLGRLAHPAIPAFLIERLFVERDAYAALIEATSAKLDAALHRNVLNALARRDREADALHAAAIYVELLAARRAPRLVVELARAGLARVSRTTDDSRRLRYVLEHGVVAALSLHALDDARAFLTGARELPDNPYSDYRVRDKDEVTPSPLAEAADRVAALESGALADQLAREREAIAAARASGKPIPADDARLAELTGLPVAARLLDDRARCTVWFYDELDELHVYDGYAVVAPAFVVVGDRRAGIADMGAFASGKAREPGPRLAALAARVPVVDERVTLADAARTQARELIRIGDRVLVLDGAADHTGPIPLRAIGLKLPGYVAARDVVARFAANPPAGLQRVDPWSAVRREYAVPVGVARLGVVGSTIEGSLPETLPPIEREHADAQAAIRALQAWEGRLFAAGGWLARIWLDARRDRAAP